MGDMTVSPSPPTIQACMWGWPWHCGVVLFLWWGIFGRYDHITITSHHPSTHVGPALALRCCLVPCAPTFLSHPHIAAPILWLACLVDCISINRVLFGHLVVRTKPPSSLLCCPPSLTAPNPASRQPCSSRVCHRFRYHCGILVTGVMVSGMVLDSAAL